MRDKMQAGHSPTVQRDDLLAVEKRDGPCQTKGSMFEAEKSSHEFQHQGRFSSAIALAKALSISGKCVMSGTTWI